MSVPHFLVTSEDLLAPERAYLSGRELHHLRVRRMRAGDVVVLVDGAHHNRRGMVERIERDVAIVRFLEAPTLITASPLELVLAQAIIRPDRLALVLEKAGELGVTKVDLFSTERTVGTASSTRLARWQRIAADATKQAQRSRVPQIAGPMPLAQVCSNANEQKLLFLWEGASPARDLLFEGGPPPQTVRVLVGPEGGFAPAEADMLIGAGFRPVSLGRYLLRSETAAIVAIALIQGFWGDLGPVCRSSQ